MKVFSRKILAVISTSLLVSFIPGVAVAQSSFSGSSSSSTSEGVFSTDSGKESISKKVQQTTSSFPIPVSPDWVKGPTPEAIEVELSPEKVADWTPTDSPKSTVVAGEMRSDREEIPGGFSKEEANLAEKKKHNFKTRIIDSRMPRVYWPSPYEVCGAIRELYDSIGGPKSFLTFPKSNELTNPDGIGKRSEFINGFIYWHPKTGAHTVSIPATVVWAANGWERGYFGYPVTSDVPLGDSWYKQQIYTHNNVLPVQAGIQGRIYDKWQELGAQNSSLGYPITSEASTPDGIGRYNLFQNGIMVWNPKFGAHAITGDILLQWVYSGAINGDVGYPISDPGEADSDGWKEQKFEKGSIHGSQLEKFFPEFLLGAGLEQDTPTLQGSGAAGGNDYTDKVVMAAYDRCGKPVVLRRGWYDPSAKRGKNGPWGYDKINHKHGIWNLYSIRQFIQGRCQDRIEGADRIYESPIYEATLTNDGKRIGTGRFFELRGVVETVIYIEGAKETRGLKTLFPLHKTNNGSDVAPRWFNLERSID
ncbi:LGFP repeat-containing protein [Corynebacterium ulcerans]|uniref:LGFP repeat-containing protein n=1 Tax=Corynebacterium ulcerans TaxID=65058 RepID=UPI0005FEAD50|nr:hypothetical protein [Corynebacterium ulcerans]AKA95717.1 Hypothetical protein CUL131002_0158 [Corynebacterium ulcerans]